MKMNDLMQNDTCRNDIILGQRKRLADFDNEVVGKLIVDKIESFIADKIVNSSESVGANPK